VGCLNDDISDSLVYGAMHLSAVWKFALPERCRNNLGFRLNSEYVKELITA